MFVYSHIHQGNNAFFTWKLAIKVIVLWQSTSDWLSSP